MKIEILTLFPGLFSGFLSESLIGKAIRNQKLHITLHNLRSYSRKRHLKVDDTPYGGGPGMLMSAEPVHRALEELQNSKNGGKKRVIFPSPSGTPLTQQYLNKLAREENLLFICGHYEGVDARILDWVDDEISLGDFVITGGELATMIICDGVGRLLPGVLGNDQSAEKDSFYTSPLLEYPQYTRPEVFQGVTVPHVLLSGHHHNIESWQRKKALEKTARVRPDLLPQINISREEKIWLKEKKLWPKNSHRTNLKE